MKRKNLIILMISLSLVLLLGSSYALLRSTQVGSNPYVINVGTLEVTFIDSETEFLNLTNMYPMSDKEGSSQDKELSFMVKNTGNVDSYYDVYIEETSTNPEFKSVIRFISNKDDKGYNQPKTLGEDKFIEVGGYLKPNESCNYKVKVWLDYDADNAYMNKTFTAKVVINSFQESNYAKDVIKSKLVKYEDSSKEDFNGGLVAVNMDGELYNETNESQEIREYRYSGSTVNNYVTFNDELWRIIGVFKDENNVEHIKIVRDKFLNLTFPETYIINNISYRISSENSFQAYWNKQVSGIINNDWATAGLQYWLNTKQDENEGEANQGYLSYLNEDSLNMIEEEKYYLGTVTAEGNSDPVTLIDVPKMAYLNERAIKGCVDNKGGEENNSKNAVESNVNCRVWAGNQATWEGKVALLYPSDFYYSLNSINWDKQTQSLSWINNGSDVNTWLISPSSITSSGKTLEYKLGLLGYNDGWHYVRPTLYLKSNVRISDGTGEENNQFKLTMDR